MNDLAKAPRRRRLQALTVAVFAAASALLFLLRPLVVSGDGVGYIKRLISPEADIVPGHLIYIPLLEWLRNLLVPQGGHAAAAIVATLVSSLGGGLACALLFWLASRLSGRLLTGVVAALGMGVSYGLFRASGDVEAYSTSTAVMTAAACVLIPAEGDQPLSWPRLCVAGVLLGLATLLHTSLVLFTPFVFVSVWMAGRDWKRAFLAISLGGALSAACFLFTSMVVLGHDLGGTVAWLRTSDNGYAQTPSVSLSYLLRNFARLFYGIGRTLVHSPAPDRLGVESSVHLSTLGISLFLALCLVTGLGLRKVPGALRWRLRSLWAWVIPLLVFGFIFFPAATERWVFLLPCLWLTFALTLDHLRRPVAIVAASVALLVPLVSNTLTVREERRLDRVTLERSRAVSQLLRRGDLLLYPGHTWDEYVGFYEDAPVERFILASFAGEERGDHDALLARLQQALDGTFARGGRVIAIRVLDAPDSHHGWNLLQALGIPRDDILALLARYEAEQVLEEPVSVWEILPAPVVTEATSPAAVSDQSETSGARSLSNAPDR